MFRNKLVNGETAMVRDELRTDNNRREIRVIKGYQINGMTATGLLSFHFNSMAYLDRIAEPI